jgi:hypothetical protein
MPALSERKIEIVRALVEAAPDRVVGGLQAALSETTTESSLAGVRRLVDAEAAERRVRNIVLQPIAPMCVADGRATDALTFPGRVLPLLWRGLQAIAPDAVLRARAAAYDLQPNEPAPEVFDELMASAGRALADGAQNEFRQAAELADAARPNGASLLAACIAIAPVVRRATQRLPDWLARFGQESGAAARLAYKDAVAISEDAGAAFFEMLAAQMAHPWMILRVICEVMDKPTERYLADSEMAIFGERVLNAVDEALKSIAKLNPDGGPGAARATGKLVELVTHQISEVETCVALSREHGWGLRIGKQRQGLASVVEGRLKEAEKLAKEALPTQAARLARIRREVPRLGSPPDERLLTRAVTMLTFVEEVRSSATSGGFGSARAKLLERLAAHIDHYVEEVLDLVKTGDAENETNAYAFLEVAAQLNLLVQGQKAAELVRRRAAAAANPDEPIALQA